MACIEDYDLVIGAVTLAQLGDMSKRPYGRYAQGRQVCGLVVGLTGAALYTLHDGKTLTLLTHYDENDEAGARTVTLDFGRQSTYEVYLLDQTHDGTLLGKVDDLTFTLPVHTSLLIREL